MQVGIWRVGDRVRLAGGPAPPPPSRPLGILGGGAADTGLGLSTVTAAVGYVVARRGLGCTDVRT